MVNRVSSYFPKGGNSANRTELKFIRTHVTEILTPKQVTENYNRITALEFASGDGTFSITNFGNVVQSKKVAHVFGMVYSS